MHSNIDTSENHYCPNFRKLFQNKSLSLLKSYITRFQNDFNFFVKISCNIFFLSFYFFQNIFFQCISTLKLAINILDWKNLNFIYPSSIHTKQFKMHLNFETSYEHSRLKKSKLHFFPSNYLVYIQQKHLSKIKKKQTETLVYTQQSQLFLQ